MEEIRLLGTKIHVVNVGQLLQTLIRTIQAGEKMRIFHLNVHAFNVLFKDKPFNQVVNDAEMVFCDGFGVKIGARLLGKKVGERMTPPDWIDDLCRTLAENNYSLFLLGDEPGVAKSCAEELHRRHPNLRIDGVHHGFFDKTREENKKVLDLINEKKPDVLLVGFGMPLQEKWITANYQQIDASIFMAVGAMFRWISGTERRAPKALTSNGFEGVWRLFTQPKKVWKRYIIEVPYFFFRILKARFTTRSDK